jgi:translocation and assembly module TamB
VLVAAFAVAAWQGSAWLFRTSGGARWALESISRYTSVKISAGRIEGSLFGHLRLEDVRVKLGDFETDVKSLDYNLQHARFLSGSFVIENMNLSGVRIHDNSAENKPPDLAWPRVSGILSALDIAIQKLALSDISYTAPRRGLHRGDMALAGAVFWRHGSLTFKNITFKTPYGTGSAEVEAGFYQPGLRFDVAFNARQKFARMDKYSFQGNLKPGRRPEQLAGKISLKGSGQAAGPMELRGDVGMTGNAFNLRNFQFSRGNRIIAGAEGSILLTVDEPEVILSLSLKDIDLKDETGIATKMGGSLTLDGTPSDYRGAFTFRNKKEAGWQKVVLTGSYTGNDRGLTIDLGGASWCSGKLEGSVSLDWQRGVVIQSRVRGSGINPGCFHPQWTGNVNFDVAGNLNWAEGTKPSGTFRGKLKESVLHGQVLQGDVKGLFKGDALFFEKLALRGNGFTVRGSGALVEKFNFSARIADLGKLVPDASGKLSMDGHIRYFEKRVSGSVRGKGRNLSLGEKVQIEKLEFDGYMGSGKDAPLFLNVVAGSIAREKLRVDSGSLKIDGTFLQHGMALFLKTGKTRMLASFTGGLRDALWQGTLDSLSGRDEFGSWKLLHPTAVVAGPRGFSVGSLVLTGEKEERLTFAGELGRKTVRGGFFTAEWRDINSKRFKNFFPKEIKSEGLLSGKMEGRGGGALSPDGVIRTEGQGSIRAGALKWRGEKGALDLSVPGADFSWSSETAAGRPPALRLNLKAQTRGSVTVGGSKITLTRGDIHFDGNEKGSVLSASLNPEGGGSLAGSFSSAEPFAISVPEKGDLKASCEGVNTELLGFLMPEKTMIKGHLSGEAGGRLLPGRRFSLGGALQLLPLPGATEGLIAVGREGGEMNVAFRNASLTWNWKDTMFSGVLSAGLAEYGRIDGDFHLPVLAALPVAFDKKGPLHASFKGKFRENGLLTLIFPGLVKESRGEVDGSAVIGGSREKLQSSGRIHLSRAGAYLPQAGIEIKDVDLTAEMENGAVRVDAFHVKSGAGVIRGKGNAVFSGGRLSEYRGSLEGSDFQLVHIPELQATANPDLTFSGTPEKFVLRGEVKLQELLIYGPPSGNFVTPSSDVVLKGRQHKAEKITVPKTTSHVHKTKFGVDHIDAKVRLTLGDRALVKMDGIDARLAGSMDLEFKNLDEIASKGEVRVVNGTYKAYGVSLEITRGRLFYAGGAINEPSLDILALRRAGDVKAGVSIGGRISTPVTKLYSDPPLADVDILSCIVFGHALSTRTSAEQIGILAQAAGLLLSRGKAASFQETLKKTFGLSALDIQSGSAGPPGSIGYTKAGGNLSQYQTVSGQTKDISETLVSVGKYLTPQLYLSYGRSLFTGSNIFSLRYDISRRWQLETVTGTESGVDLYYKIFFK